MQDRWTYLKRLITKRAPVIFQVGARHGIEIGSFRRLWPRCTIYCFEPRTDAFVFLTKKYGGDRRIHLVNKAVSKTKALMDFHVAFHPGQSSLLKRNTKSKFYTHFKRMIGTIKVQTITLDGFCERQDIETIDLLYIDVQGGELAAFQGATGLLGRSAIDVIYTEVFFMDLYQDCPQFKDVKQYLEGHQYQFLHLFNFYGKRLETFPKTSGDALFVKGD